MPKENPHGWHGRVPSVHFLSFYFFSVYIRSTALELEGSSFQFLEAETPSFPISFATKKAEDGSDPTSGPVFFLYASKILQCPAHSSPRPSDSLARRRLAPRQPSPDAYGHTTGNTPEPVRFQKLSLVRPS